MAGTGRSLCLLSLSLWRGEIHREETGDLFIRIGPPSRPSSLSLSMKTRAIPVQFLRPPPFIAGAKNDERVYCRPTVFPRCNCASPPSPLRILSFFLSRVKFMGKRSERSWLSPNRKMTLRTEIEKTQCECEFCVTISRYDSKISPNPTKHVDLLLRRKRNVSVSALAKHEIIPTRHRIAGNSLSNLTCRSRYRVSK